MQMDGGVWRFAPVLQSAAAEVVVATGLTRGLAGLIAGWYSPLDSTLDLPPMCIGAEGAVLHLDEESETLLCADGGPAGCRLWACCLATRAFAHRKLGNPAIVGPCYAVDSRSVEMLITRPNARHWGFLARWSVDVRTGEPLGFVDDQDSWRYARE